MSSSQNPKWESSCQHSDGPCSLGVSDHAERHVLANGTLGRAIHGTTNKCEVFPFNFFGEQRANGPTKGSLEAQASPGACPGIVVTGMVFQRGCWLKNSLLGSGSAL